MRQLLFILSLGLAGATTADVAHASGPADEGARQARGQQSPRAAAAEARRDRKRALQALIRIELDSAQGIVQIFKEGIERKDITLSEESTTSFDTSREAGKEARRLSEADDTVGAYEKAREATVALAPVISEVLEQEKAPQPVVRLVEKQMLTMTDRVKRVTPHVAAVGEEATAAHEAAKALHGEATELWSGEQKKAGFEKFVEALVQLDKAIRLAVIEGPARPTPPEEGEAAGEAAPTE